MSSLMPRISRTHKSAAQPKFSPYIADSPSSSTSSLLDLPAKSSFPTNSCTFFNEWATPGDFKGKNAKPKLCVRASSLADGHAFKELAAYIQNEPMIRAELASITLESAQAKPVLMSTDTLNSILFLYSLPKLETVTLRNVTLVHLEISAADIPLPFALKTLTLEGLGNVTVHCALWFLAHFSTVEWLSLRMVDVIRDDQYHYATWHVLDLENLVMPQALEVSHIDIKDSSTSRFYINLTRNTPSINVLESVSVTCAHEDDLISLGGLLRERGPALKGLTVSIADCFVRGGTSLKSPLLIDQYMSYLQNCTSLEDFTVEMYLDNRDFALNALAWHVVANIISYVPVRSIENVTLEFFVGSSCNDEVDSIAIAALNWAFMEPVLDKFVIPSQPNITIHANTAFDNMQLEFIVQKLPKLYDMGTLYITGEMDDPQDAFVDEVQQRRDDVQFENPDDSDTSDC